MSTAGAQRKWFSSEFVKGFAEWIFFFFFFFWPDKEKNFLIKEKSMNKEGWVWHWLIQWKILSWKLLCGFFFPLRLSSHSDFCSEIQKYCCYPSCLRLNTPEVRKIMPKRVNKADPRLLSVEGLAYKVGPCLASRELACKKFPALIWKLT